MGSWKHIKIFVSSTFKDMDMERDALKNIVIPKLNEAFMPHKLHVSIVDLRHSVETDTSLDIEERERRVFQVCMDEIDSCKPYFLGLVGHRYGWIPSLNDMNPDFYERLALPADFPISKDELSVTVCEFIHSLFNTGKPTEHSFVLMRSADSYSQLGDDARREYFDEGRNGELIDSFRTYLTNFGSAACLMEYSLDLNDIGGNGLQAWCDKIYEALLKEIEKELSDRENLYDEDYLIRQQKFISRHTVNFKGREEVLQKCMSILHSRGALYLYQDENGLGSTSLACKLYAMLAESDKFFCLYHNTDISPQAVKYENVLYYWNRQLLKFLEMDHGYLNEIRDMADCLYEEFRRLCSIVLEKRGRKVAIFTEGTTRLNNYFALKFAFNYYIDVIPTGERSSLNIIFPYIVEELNDKDFEILTCNLRRAAREALSRKRQSRNIKWLQRAIHILEHLNRSDYEQIRSSEQDGRQEESISDYLVGIIGDMPDDFDELSVFWVERLKGIYGRFVSEYLYILSVTSGVSDQDLSAMTGRTIDWCTYFRYILGREVVSENSDGFIELDPEMAKSIRAHADEEFHVKMCRIVLNYICGLPSSSQTYIRNIFSLAMHLDDYQACQKYIADPDNYVANANESAAITSLEVIAKNDPEKCRKLIDGITEAAPLEYNSFHLLNLWISQITAGNHLMYLHMSLPMHLKLEAAFDGNLLSSEATLALVEVYFSIGNAYVLSDIPGRENIWKRLNDRALSICYEHVNESLEWNEMFMHIMYDTYEGYSNLKERWRFLEDSFITVERNGIDYDDRPGFLYYAFLLREYALLLARFAHSGAPDVYIRKAYQIISSFKDKSVAEWLSITVIFNRLSEDFGMPGRNESMALMKGVIENMFRMSDKFTHLHKTGVLLSELVASYAIRLSETDRQEAMDILDRMVDLCLMQYENPKTVQDQKLFESWNMDYLVRRVTFMEHTHDICYMYISFAWTLAARIHINSLGGEGVTSKYSSFDDDFDVLMKLQQGKVKDIWDRELDKEFILCTAIHSKLKQMQREGFPDKVEARKMVSDYMTLSDNSRMHYRKINFRQLDEVNAIDRELTDKESDINDRIPQEKLEEMIESGQYSFIIDRYSNRRSASKEEFYYLGMAYLRSGMYDLAMKRFHILINISGLPEGYVFSCKVNYLFAALAARDPSAFIREYAKLSEEDKEDSDVIPLFEAYCNLLESGILTISEPYGYML